MDDRANSLVKWLRMLLWLHLASLAISLAAYLTPNDSWAAWVNRAVTAAIAFSLFHLEGKRYRTAAVLRSVMLVLAVVSLALSAYMTRLLAAQQPDQGMKVLISLASVSLGTVQLILSYPATWLEQSSHAALIREQDAALAKRWRRLLLWQILATVLVSVGTGIASQLVLQFQWSVTGMYSIVLALLQLPVKLVNVLYILYMHRTIRLVQQKEEW